MRACYAFAPCYAMPYCLLTLSGVAAYAMFAAALLPWRFRAQSINQSNQSIESIHLVHYFSFFFFFLNIQLYVGSTTHCPFNGHQNGANARNKRGNVQTQVNQNA